MSIHQRVTYQDAILIMLEDHLFLEDDTTHTIEGSGHFVTIKLTDVLVTLWAVVVALILMQAKVELCTMLYHRHVEGAQQDVVLVIQFGNGNYEQAMVLTRIAIHDSGTRISP